MKKFYQFPGSKNRVRVYWYNSLKELKKSDEDAGDSLAYTTQQPTAPNVAEVHLPLTTSPEIIIHEALHAAFHHAKFRNLRGGDREEWLALDTGRLAAFLLRQWEKLTAKPRL